MTLNAQEAGHIYRIGFLTAGLREAVQYVAFFDELRMAGFIEGQNLALVAGGFGVRNEQLSEAAAAIMEKTIGIVEVAALDCERCRFATRRNTDSLRRA